MAVDRDVVAQQLRELGDFHQFFTSKEIAFLPEVLAEGETAQGITSGFFEGKTWIIVVTELRLLFLDKGMFYGLRQIDMPLSKISSITQSTGLFFGEIEISTASGTKKITTIPKRNVLKISSILSGLIHGGRTKKADTNAVVVESLASQLERLETLWQKGALTDEEFERCKSRLIGS